MVYSLWLSLTTFFFSVLLLGVDSRHELYPRQNQGFLSKPNVFDPSRVTQISWHPRVFLYEDFLSSEESDHLISLAKGKLQKSMVVDNENGTSVPSNVRTSSGHFISSQDEVVTRIATRIAAWTFLPPENAERFHVLRYQHGEKYEPHFDYFPDRVNQQLRAGQRYATLLLYLSNVQKGGETIFPYAEVKVNQTKDETWSDCAKKGYAVKPKKGDALLFFNLYINTTTDSDSIHGSCPVMEGEKWVATRWIHVRSHGMGMRSRATTDMCIDENVNCPEWAEMGECEKNPAYMVGLDQSYGHCRLSCKVCQPVGLLKN
ncbi:procollagen-proline 4-dioxygenase [Ranunculus cassubicifolius]